MSEWISVNERLPEKDVEALVASYGTFYLASIDSEGWCETTEGRLLEQVTHWMPLPAPPTD